MQYGQPESQQQRTTTGGQPVSLDEIIKKTQDAAAKIEAVVEMCHPAISGAKQTFTDSMLIAYGISELKRELNRPEIRKMVESLVNSRLGFMTDRTPAALKYNEKRGKGPTWPYKYDEIVDCCIDALMNGYRLTGNEMNIIAGNFYGAKAGKKRKIEDHPGVTDFDFSITTPVHDGQYAKVQAFADWKQGGQPRKIGYSENGKEGRLFFKIRVNKMMGEDAIMGKAESKLFRRVLMSITGRSIPESTDIGEEVAPEPEKPTLPAGDNSDAYKPQKLDKPEAAPEPKTFADAVDEKAEEAEKAANEPPDWPAFRKSWIHIRSEKAFYMFAEENAEKFTIAPDEIRADAREKWDRLGLTAKPKCLGPWPDAEPEESPAVDEKSIEYQEYLQACAIDEALAKDARVVLFGEDREPKYQAEVVDLIEKIKQLFDAK